jgi:hypothetical protein
MILFVSDFRLPFAALPRNVKFREGASGGRALLTGGKSTALLAARGETP